jgi:PEP-CTERM motif-containing protein
MRLGVVVLGAALLLAASFGAEAITQVSLSGASFSSLNQPRISGAEVTAVSEPAAFTLLGLGLAGIGFARRRTRRGSFGVPPIA